MKISDTAVLNADIAGVRALAGVAVGVAAGRC